MKRADTILYSTYNVWCWRWHNGLTNHWSDSMWLFLCPHWVVWEVWFAWFNLVVSASCHMGLILRLTKCRPRINPVYSAQSALVSTDGLILNRNFVIASCWVPPLWAPFIKYDMGYFHYQIWIFDQSVKGYRTSKCHSARKSWQCLQMSVEVTIGLACCLV